MVREDTTTPKTSRPRQWISAWLTLTLEQRLAIIEFCVRADRDVADAALAVKI